MNLIRDVSMIEFWPARFASEKNQETLRKGKRVEKLLSLDEDEAYTLAKLNSKATLTHDELVLKQKLTIKYNVYACINGGKFLCEIDFVVPLEIEDVYPWLRNFGYALGPKLNTVWITRPDGWQYEDPNSPPPSKTVFNVLW